MLKRTAAAVLWFYAGLCLGALASFVLGLPDVTGPAVAFAGAAFVLGDPAHIIWAQPAR